MKVDNQKYDEDIEFLCHNDCLTLFNEELYSGVFTEEHITSKKRSITIGDRKFYGYVLEKDNTLYFLIEKLIDKIPFKIVGELPEFDYRSDVYKTILPNSIVSIKIPTIKHFEFRELVDIFGKFKHTKPKHFMLYKIIVLASMIDRINTRIVTESGFGKDSGVEILRELMNGVVNLYGATFAKLEYVLQNKVIVLNEMGNLKSEDKHNMQEFLLAAGAYHNKYIKRTRKTNMTKEEYDISKLSLMILHNMPEYYTTRGQEYFDLMFTPAVVKRFIPFVFDGYLATPFEKMISAEVIVKKYNELYKKIISTISYFKQNKPTTIDYEVPEKVFFAKKHDKYARTFNTLMKYLSLYSDNQEEFNELTLELFECYKKYEALASFSSIMDIENISEELEDE